jgi:hypothetical protein
MKRINIFLSVAFVLFGLAAMQSCTKDDSPVPVVYKAAVIVNPTPADAATFELVGNSMDVVLKWDGSATVAPKWDVYFGTDPEKLVKVASQITSNNFTKTITTGATYYWSVYTIDANGVYSQGPVWSFTATQKIDAFVGKYNVLEPAESWNYDVSFKKLTGTTIQIGNGAGTYDGWWASWPAVFTLNFTTNTYSMPKQDFGGGYSGEESGTINLATGQMVGTYTIWKNNVVNETGTHTYNKK